MKHIKNIALITMFSIIILGLAVSMYLQYAPIKIIEIKNPLRVGTPTVKAGDVFTYMYDYCLYKQYPAAVSRTLVDHSFLPLPITNSVGELGCHKTEMQIPVPEGAKVGIYHLEGIISYQVTPNRTINVPFYTENFNIIK